MRQIIANFFHGPPLPPYPPPARDPPGPPAGAGQNGPNRQNNRALAEENVAAYDDAPDVINNGCKYYYNK